MTTKVCVNNNCPGYGHFVFTVAMRCYFCHCDLSVAQRNARMAEAPRHAVRLPQKVAGRHTAP
jgi:hypothetical protein